MARDKGAVIKCSSWRVWLRLEGGGIMGTAYPAQNRKHAERLAEEAARVFKGDIMELEDMGVITIELG